MATTRRGKMRSQKQKASWRRRSEEHVGRKAIGAMATALGASPIGRQTEFFIFFKLLQYGDALHCRPSVAK